MAVRIDRAMREMVDAELKADYIKEFGDDVFTNPIVHKTRLSCISSYVRNVNFWASRVPPIEELRDPKAVARYPRPPKCGLPIV